MNNAFCRSELGSVSDCGRSNAGKIDSFCCLPADVKQRYRSDGVLGLGESYIEGNWDTGRLDDFMFDYFISVSQSCESGHSNTGARFKILYYYLKELLLNPQRGLGAYVVARRHYDLGNDLFRHMLDESMSYTCGYWKAADSLTEAQEHKLELICRKIGLVPGMRILDVGCGWGNFAKFAAERYGVSVVGLTISEEQARFARPNCSKLPVEILLQDYHLFDASSHGGPFDRVVSIEMIEAVGRKNLKGFFEIVSRSLKDEGLFLLQAISSETASRHSVLELDQFLMWILKYIFPNGYIPKITELLRPCRLNIGHSGLVLEDLQSFGPDYDRTLMAWAANFNSNWQTISESTNYDEEFRRRWNFYLYTCAALFRARWVQLYQIVYSKGGCRGGLQSVR